MELRSSTPVLGRHDEGGVKTAVVAGMLVLPCSLAFAQGEESRVTARDNAVVKAVLEDLLRYHGKDSPLGDPFGPSKPLPVMRTPLRGKVSLRAVDSCGVDQRPWRTLTEVRQRATEEAARDLERRAPLAGGRWEFSVRDVEIHEEGRRPRNDLGLDGGIDISLPGYSPGGRIAIVLFSMPWSIHSATGTYVLRFDDTSWTVILREFAYTL
jgi:hypothetical protein